jgi:NAD-dependent DNA ligase
MEQPHGSPRSAGKCLFRELRALEAAYPKVQSSDSPTQRVGDVAACDGDEQ